MGNIFSGSEIVEIGVQIEKNGRDFYNELVSKSKKQEAKKIFEHLAGEEAKHIAMFQKILDSVQKYEPPEAYSEEYFAFMRSLASQYVFTQENTGTEMAKNAKSDSEAVEMGIKFEQESITFYEGMKKVVPEHDHKIVDEIIRQEQEHLRRLTDVKSLLD
jgi:rubrerythrin